MIGPNLSDWALKHRSFVIFAMIAVTIAGLASYFRLGRSEDPAFTFHGGLFVATMLTLIVLPALYIAWFRVKEPTREQAAA